MSANILKIHVSWNEKNFCCGWSDPQAGTVVATAKTLPELKRDFEQSLKWHIEGCIADGDALPDHLVNGNYELKYELDISALLRDAETYTTLSAISQASGINQKQLSHYANGIKHPRLKQRAKIISGLHEIASHLMAIY